MKEEWKVYIKGVPDRGAEVIKVLEDIGGRDSYLRKGEKDDWLYYIDHEGKIDYDYLESEISKIIMDNYREIKLPEKWKDGDILYNETNKVFAVVKFECNFNTDIVVPYFVSHYGKYLTKESICKRDFRLATKSEITQFHERLHHSLGKDWDAEKKRLIDLKWKPEIDETFWFISGNNRILSLKWNNSHTDNEFFDFGNCFKTKEEAEAMVEKIKKLLKG